MTLSRLRSRLTHANGERGFTIIEVMVSVMLLTIGVLSSVSLVDGANRTTSMNRARENATTIGRTLLEAAHGVPYTSLTKTGATTALTGQPGLPADSNGAKTGWQVARDKVEYTITVNVCAVDDDRDGVGANDSSFCSVGTPTSPPDSRPADYKRFSATITWNDDTGARTLTKSDVISGSYRGPSVMSLTTTTNSPFTYWGGPSTIDYAVTTTSGTDNVKWTLDGNEMGSASGSGTSWNFSWALGTPTGSSPCSPTGGGTVDGTYIVGADAYDANGLSENGRALTMRLNRCPPLPPTGFEGGNTILWPGAEFQWDPSPEEDVIGYRLYSSAAATGPWAQVPQGQSPDTSQPDCGGTGTDNLIVEANCVTATVNGQKKYFAVRAVDRAPDGTVREGDLSPAILTDPSNNAPGKPGAGDDNAFPYSLKWGGKAVSDPPPADYTDFYYIYREDKSGRIDRYDSIDNNAGTVYWTDPDPGTGTWTYYVTAVDNHLAESQFAPANGITLP